MHDDSLYTDLRGTLARVNDLADSIQKGDGTIGKLMKDPALYDDTRATIGDLRIDIGGPPAREGHCGQTAQQRRSA